MTTKPNIAGVFNLLTNPLGSVLACNQALLEKVIATQVAFGAVDREDALRWIAVNVERNLYEFAKLHDVLVEGSAEEFAIQFYNAYNAEIGIRY